MYGRKTPLVVCPFNKSHILRSSRLQYHLVKCKEHYKGTKIPCPYNATEYVEPDEMVQHLSTCNYRAQREIAYFSSKTSFNKNIFPATFKQDSFPTEENWGIDPPNEDEGNSSVVAERD